MSYANSDNCVVIVNEEAVKEAISFIELPLLLCGILVCTLVAAIYLLHI